MGSIVKRGGKYGARAYIGYKEGKRQYKWLGTFDKKRDAERAIREVENARDMGVKLSTGKQSVSTYMMTWLDSKRTEVRWNTFKKYRWLTTNHVIPNLGDYQLEKLGPEHLQRLYSDLQLVDKPLSNRSILHLHNMMHAALDRAAKWGMIQRNVAELVSPPSAVEKDKQTWTPEQLRRFLNCAENYRYGIVFLLAAMTGMRKAEISGLRWCDIDIKSRQLHIRHTLVAVTGEGLTLQETKTTRSRRTISLDQMTVDSLTKHRKRQLQEKMLLGSEYEEMDFVIALENGRPVYPRTIDNQWIKCVREANVPYMGIHGLRHTHASTLIAQGVPVNVVSERLGHARTSITMDIYVHSNSDQQRQAADSFAASIFGEKHVANQH